MVRRWVRTGISLLIHTGPAGDPAWRFSVGTVLALVGPGSVPFALLMFAVQRQLLLTEHSVPPDVALLLAVAPALGIVVARFQPVVAWGLTLAGVAVSAVVALPGATPWPWTPPQLFALMIVQYAVARHRREWAAVAAWAGSLLVTYGLTVTTPMVEPRGQILALVGLLSALALVVGVAVRVTVRSRQRLAEEERLTAEERARRGLLEERARIARDLHDVVAHHMSVITVQATSAEYRLPDVSEPVRAEFRSIGEQARESLTELRRLLAVLRNEDDAAPRSPQPGLERVDSIADSARRTGVPVRVSVNGTGSLPEQVSTTAYRIIQEALSNVVRHAPGAATTVSAELRDGTLVVDVVNGPSEAATPHDLTGTGLGLAGMRERVALLGGELTAEPTSDGGFLVRALLPAVTAEGKR